MFDVRALALSDVCTLAMCALIIHAATIMVSYHFRTLSIHDLDEVWLCADLCRRFGCFACGLCLNCCQHLFFFLLGVIWWQRCQWHQRRSPSDTSTISHGVHVICVCLHYKSQHTNNTEPNERKKNEEYNAMLPRTNLRASTLYVCYHHKYKYYSAFWLDLTTTAAAMAAEVVAVCRRA